MKLHELSPAPGSKKDAFRKGRGHGSGNGKTAGKGLYQYLRNQICDYQCSGLEQVR